MEKYVVVNADGKFIANTTKAHELILTDDINNACLHDEDVVCDGGFSVMKVNVFITVVPALIEKLEIVEHTTARNKIIKGVIRKDISSAQAKAIDPYTFPKDGGHFIREQYLQ